MFITYIIDKGLISLIYEELFKFEGEMWKSDRKVGKKYEQFVKKGVNMVFKFIENDHFIYYKKNVNYSYTEDRSS